MTNNLGEFCLLENWSQNASMSVINSEQQSLLQDPYDSIWLKIVAILSYFIGLTREFFMLLCFMDYQF